MDITQQKGIDWINSNSYEFTEWGFDPYPSHPIFYAFNDYCNESTGIPQTTVIDADGNVRYAKLGMISEISTMIAVIDELI